ncbi:MAG: right-handed parallel beta-helix repeat-containing protein, partial [Candidatus Bathyarchaeia archaeon]
MSKKDKKTRKNWKERLRERQIRYQRALESYRIRREREAEKKPKGWSKGKILGVVCLIALILSVFAVWQSIQPYNQSHPPSASQGEQQTPSPPLNAIYIRANGSIEPSTAPISKVKKDQYVLTADVYLPIVVERDNIIIDGGGHVLQGMNVYGSKGIDLTDRSGVTIKNMTIKGFDYGLYLVSASNNVLLQNNLTDNYCGIWLAYSSYNRIVSNTLTKNDFCGIWLKNSL